MSAKPAHSVEKYFPLFEKKTKKVVLDYGSGNLRNALFLHRKGYKVFAVDLPHKIKYKNLPRLSCVFPEDITSLKIKTDIVICTFVLNLLTPFQRSAFLSAIAQIMTPGGYLLVETKGFSLLQLDRMILPRGFIRIHNLDGRYTKIGLYQFSGLIC